MIRPPTVVLGVGNPMRGDDGVGPAVLARLRDMGIGDGSVELIALDGEPTGLLAAWQGRRLAVVIDAMVSGLPPGSVRRMELGRDQLPPSAPAASSHGVGVVEAVALSRALAALPDRLVLLAAECATVTLGEGLSAPVAAAVPELAALACAELGAVRGG